MKPASVRQAQQREDSATLRALGRKGAKVHHDNESVRRAIAKEYDERRLDEAQAMALERRDDLVPPEDR